MLSVDKFYNDMLITIEQKLRAELPPECSYHSADHTLDVLKQTEVVGKAQGLNEEQLTIVKIAALFHDVGFVEGRKNHEAVGCMILRQYAVGYALSEDHIRQIEGCIMATKIPQSPRNLMEEVICDADLDYLGRDDFKQISDLLFHELKACGEITSREQWNQIQVKFLSGHRYHTSYSIKNRSEKLNYNLEGVKNQMN